MSLWIREHSIFQAVIQSLKLSQGQIMRPFLEKENADLDLQSYTLHYSNWWFHISLLRFSTTNPFSTLSKSHTFFLLFLFPDRVNLKRYFITKSTQSYMLVSFWQKYLKNDKFSIFKYASIVKFSGYGAVLFH